MSVQKVSTIFTELLLGLNVEDWFSSWTLARLWLGPRDFVRWARSRGRNSGCLGARGSLKKNSDSLCLHNEESAGLPRFYGRAMPRCHSRQRLWLDDRSERDHYGDNWPYVQISTLTLAMNGTGIFHCFRLSGASRYENYVDSLVLFRAP